MSGLSPAIAALYRARAPISVDIRTLARLRIGAGARVVSLSGRARTVRPIGRSSSRIGAGTGIVSGAHADAAVRTIGAVAAAVCSGVRVIPGSHAIGVRVA